MKIRILLISTLIATNLCGQENDIIEPTADFKKLQIGINFSPDYCYRTLESTSGSWASTTVLDFREATEIGKPGFTTGLNLIFNFNAHIGIEAGIQYSNKGYQTKMSELIYGSMIDRGSGFESDPFLPIKGMFIMNYHYLDIPLKLNYIFGHGNIRFIASAGVATNILLSATTTSVLEYEDGNRDRNTETTSYDYNDINLSPLVSMGIDWKLNSNNNLRIEPTFRYGVLRIIDGPVTGYLWNAGLNIGYYFGLK